MSEEIADSGESAEVSDSIIESGVESISNDLFGGSEEVEEDLEFLAEEDVLPEESEEPKVELRKAPDSWKKEMHEHWNKLTPEQQDYIELREKQMSEGLEINKEDSTLGRSMRDILSPYQQSLQANNIDGQTMVKNLLGAHYKLSTAPQHERSQLMQRLARSYGVDLSNPGAKPNSAMQSIQHELNSLKGQLQKTQEASRQEERNRLTKQLTEFAENHEHFDEVGDDIVQFINNGDTLESAYEKAIWANPVTRQKEIERQAKTETEDQMKAKMEKVRAAKKAKSANVNSRETGKTPTGPLGTMEDTMRDTFREIQNRN